MPATIKTIDFDIQSRVRKIVGIISGIVLFEGKPVSREVVIYRRHDQIEVARQKSDPITGRFSFSLTDNSNVFYRVVVIAGSVAENSQIQDYITVVP